MPETPTYEELQNRVRELESVASESKKELELLRQKDDLYRNLFRHMLHEVHVWKLVHDDEGNIKTWRLVDANPAALRTWNKELPEVVGKTTDEIFPGSGATEQFMPIVKRIFAEGKPHIWEAKFANTNQLLHMVSIPLGEYFISTGWDISEARQIEEELRLSERRFRNLAEHVPVLVIKYKLHPDGSDELLYISKSVEDLFEISLEEASSDIKLLKERIHEDDLEEWAESVKTSAENQSLWEHEYRIQMPDGRVKWLFARGAPIQQDDGSVVWDTVALDITERKQAEAALWESEGRLQTLLQSIQAGVIVHGPNTEILACNTAALDVLGLTGKEVFGKEAGDSHWHFVHEDGSKLTVDEFPVSIVLRTQEPLTDYCLGVVPPERDVPVWVQVNAVPEFDDDGHIQNVVVTAMDITARKQAEAALRDSEEKFRSLVEQAAEMLFVHDLEGNIIDVNFAAVASTGYSAEELKGMSVFDIDPDARDRKDMEKYWKALKLGDRPFLVEVKHKRKDGSLYPGEVSGCKIVYQGGEYILALSRDISERKKAEEALRQKDAMLARLASQVPGMLYQFMMKPDGSYSVPYSSRAVQDMFGCSPEDVQDDFEPIFEAIHPDDRDEILRTIDESKRNLSQWKCEYRVQLPGEPVKWIFGNSIPEKMPDGSIIWSGYNVDVTERKIEEEERLRYEKDLRESQRIAHLGSWRLNVETNEVYWTEQLYEMYGFDPTLPPPPYTEHSRLFTPESWEVLSTSLQRTRDTGIPYELELEMVRADGSKGWMWVRGEVVKDSRGETVGLWGAAQDITDRKQAETALKESEEKYRLVVEKADEAIFIGQDDVIKFPNPKTLELSGYSEEELATMPFAELVHPDDRQMVVERFHKRLKGESPPSDYTIRIVNKSGAVVWVQNMVGLTTWDGRPATINLVRDISQRRQLENQLHQAEKIEAIATLTGGIAHDYNNLLSVIVGNLGLAQQDARPESNQAEFLEQAEKAAHKAGDLTHQLMALSRGGAPVRELGSIRDLVELSAEVISPDSGIAVDVQLREDLWPVPHDARKLVSVFRNVVQNALEAMAGGAGELTLQARNLVVKDGDAGPGPFLEPGNYVWISFKDSGIGIPAEDLDKIFDPYFSTKPMGIQKGRGLGLATAHAIVKKHGGEMNVLSKPGEGTTVNIYLPAQPGENDGGSDEAVLPDQQATVGIEQGPMRRVLLMDDEEMLRDLTKEMLGRMGYEVETAADGFEAVELYRSQLDSEAPFDVVVLDLTVRKGMGGEAALRELLNVDPDVKAIVASGYSNDPVMEKFQECGFKAALAKPYAMRDLEEAIEAVVSVKD